MIAISGEPVYVSLPFLPIIFVLSFMIINLVCSHLLFYIFVRFLYSKYWRFYSDCRYVKRIRRSLLICFIFKNSIMGRKATRMRGLIDTDDEDGFLLMAPPAAAAAAPLLNLPVGWLTFVFGL